MDDDAEETPHIKNIIRLFVDINSIVHEGLSADESLIECIYKELLYNDDIKEHLPIPVFSYIAPTIETSFLLYFMLSEGGFET